MLRITHVVALAVMVAMVQQAPAQREGAGATAAARVGAERVAALKSLVTAKLDVINARLAVAQRAGNVSDLSAARREVALCEQLLDSLAKTGELTFPEQFRRELAPMIDDLRAERDAIVARFVVELEIASEEAVDEEDDIGLEPDVPTTPPVLPPATPGTPSAVVPPATPGTPLAAPEADVPAAVRYPGDVVLASNGEAQNWVTLGTLYVEVASVEVVSFSLFGISDIVRQDLTSLATGAAIQLLYAPKRQMWAGPTAFRLLSVEGRPGVTVLSWPTANNLWTVEARCRPEGQAPFLHGVVIQAAGGDLGAGTPSPLSATPPLAPPAAVGTNRVSVSIQTQPPGATVVIDGTQQLHGDAPVRTPCVVEVDAGERTIVLSLSGYQDARAARFQVKEGVAVRVRLDPDPRFRRQTVQVTSGREWTRSGVRAARGERVTLMAQGRWACAPDRRFCGPEGYPDTAEFAAYARDPAKHPRQTRDGAYGTLLLRIGADGPILAAGAGTEVSVDQAGEVLLDINELPGSHRLDNTGSVTVEVVVGPGR